MQGTQYGQGLFKGVAKRLREVDAGTAVRPLLGKWEKNIGRPKLID